MAKNSNDVIGMVEPLFAQLPKLPKNAKDTLVKIAPWLALIFGILGVLAGLAGFGLMTAFMPFAAVGGATGFGFGYVSALVLVVSSVLMLAAYPGLKANKMSGWNLLFWGEVLNLAYGIIAMSIFGSVIGSLIGFYLLFQVKSYYK